MKQMKWTLPLIAVLLVAAVFVFSPSARSASSYLAVEQIWNRIFNSTNDSIRVTVDAENLTGNAAIGGALTVTGAAALDGGLTMDTNKFTVANGTGNTAIAGTLAVAGVTTFSDYADLYVGVAATQSYSITSDGKANVIDATYSTAGASTLHLMTDMLVSGRVVEIVDAGGSAGSNNITIDTENSSKINGSDTFVISTNYKHVRCVTNGTNWFCY